MRKGLTVKTNEGTLDPSVARLLDWIYDDENGVSHCCGQRGTGEDSRPELEAKINRLIDEAYKKGYIDGGVGVINEQ